MVQSIAFAVFEQLEHKIIALKPCTVAFILLSFCALL